MLKPNPAPIRTRTELSAVTAHRRPPKAAVLLVNLGTPDAPKPWPLRRYLREFLSDRRVVELPRLLWWPILYLIILPLRARKSARAYASIWTEQGSPLLFLSRRLAELLDQRLAQISLDVQVMLAMNYGQPSIDQAIDRLRADNVQRLLVLPLYPQYSATTTASVFDRVTRSLSRLRWLPELRFINDYHGEEGWLDAVARSVRDFQQGRDRPDKLVFSFHGIPKRNLLAGDPYYCQCQVSARRIANRLGLTDDQWQLSFQSRLGKAEWLKPYTDKTLQLLAKEGVRRVQVVCPGFAVDCLETLEEIAVENRDEFIEAGGEQLDYIPCLNDSAPHAALLEGLIRRHGQGWPEFDGIAAIDEAALQRRVERADQAAQQLGLPT